MARNRSAVVIIRSALRANKKRSTHALHYQVSVCVCACACVSVCVCAVECREGGQTGPGIEVFVPGPDIDLDLHGPGCVCVFV